MASYVVWLDHQHAKFFKITDKVEQFTKKNTEAEHQKSHHTGHSNDQVATNAKYFHDLAHSLSDAKEVLLVGPGLAKKHLMTHLETHHHAQLKNKVLGVEDMDHPTDREIMAFARKFFKSKDVFSATASLM